MSARNSTGADAQNDSAELPADWTETDTSEVAKFEHETGAVLRVRTELPTRSAAACNRGERVDATGEVRVLYHPDGVPGESREIHAGGTEQDGRDAALQFMAGRCPEHDRELTTDAVGALHCPTCTGADR